MVESPENSNSVRPPEERLDSWKEIAAYLDRDVTTVQRWEKREGMPVHRHLHDKSGSVYALSAELDDWLRSRNLRSRVQEEDPREAEEQVRWKPALRRLRYWAVAAAMVAIGLAAYFIIARGRGGAPTAVKIRSLAVLPLKNLSGDPSQEYLADGMTDALIGRLAGIHELRVISYTSAMRFKNPQIAIPEIAKDLGVDVLVEGSVMRQGDRIRITAQLIRGATDDHFWSETYDGSLRDVLTLQSDVAQAIAEKVEVTVTGGEHERLTAARAVAPEVYESYLKGRYALDQSDKRSDIELAMGDFCDAIKRDASFAPAYMGLAEAYSELDSNFIGDPPEAARQNQMDAARKAIELDPDLYEAHDLLADAETAEWQWAEAETEYQRALELNSSDPLAHLGLAWWFLSHGRADEALGWAERGRELDPVTIDSTDIGWMLVNARRYDEALRELRTSLTSAPDDPVALWDTGILLIVKNQPRDAILVLEKALPLSNRSPGVMGTLICAYARAGRRSDALRLLAELNGRRHKGFVPAQAFVEAYLGLGENDQAFAWLEQGYKEHSVSLRLLKVDPRYDPLRSDPRFADLVRRVGLD